MADAGDVPTWFAVLDDEDRPFLRKFLLASGSLKELAEQYGISYPTIRGRLDRLIAKVLAAEDPKIADEFERRLRVLVAEGTLAVATAKDLLTAHRAAMKKEGGR